MFCCELLPFLLMNTQDIQRQWGFLYLLCEFISLELFLPILAEQCTLCSELFDPQLYLLFIGHFDFRIEEFLYNLIDMMILTLLAIQLLLDVHQFHLIRHVHSTLFLLQSLRRHGAILELHLPAFQQHFLPAFEERCEGGQQLHYYIYLRWDLRGGKIKGSWASGMQSIVELHLEVL